MEAVDGRGVRLTPRATYALSPCGGGAYALGVRPAKIINAGGGLHREFRKSI